MAGQLDAAAWSALGTPSHRCDSCGAKCRRCAEGEACAQARWCNWCANAYAENPPAADGLVYCGGPDPDAEHGCGRSLPGLARLIERGLSQYPLYCGECRDAQPPPVPEPELDGDGPEPADPPPSTPEPAERRSGASNRGTERADPHARHLRGGFAPRAPQGKRAAPQQEHSEMGVGETAHPVHQYRP